jgi:hypothetical protein
MVLKDLGELEEAREIAKQAYETFLGWRDASISIHGLKPVAGKDPTG